MTLVLSITGPETVWAVADRRLSYAGRPPRDDARKIMFLESTDTVAILSYAGLGETAAGTEPADWMSAVLRGRNLPLEASLEALAQALRREMPPHLLRLPGQGPSAHSVVIAALCGDEPRLYTIDLAFSQDRKSYQFRYTRWVRSADEPKPRTPRFAAAGSGALYLYAQKEWRRSTLRLVNAHDRRQVSSLTVADALAALSHQVHVGVTDGTVGPRSIVAWRNRRKGVHKGGGGHQFYSGLARDSSSPSLPTIANGMDIHALVDVMMPHMTKHLEALQAGTADAELDKDALNADLDRLPDTPDERLR